MNAHLANLTLHVLAGVAGIGLGFIILARTYVLSWKRYWSTVRTCKLYDYANHRWLDFKGRVTSAPLFPESAPAAG